MTALCTKKPDRPYRWTDTLAPGGRRALSFLATIAIVLLFLGPIVILVVTSLRPGWAVFYIYSGTDFTLQNYRDVLSTGAVMRAFVNSFLVATRVIACPFPSARFAVDIPFPQTARDRGASSR